VTDQLTHLDPETRSVVRAYLAELEAALSTMRAQERRDALDDAEEFFAESLTAESRPEDAIAVAEELGSAPEFAASMLGALGRRPGRTPVASPAADNPKSGMASGTVLGLPYDVRVPTASRVALRWWDPTNPAIFVPRVWGIGWDINFGAIAVKLGLIRPDDEDEPFGAVPTAAMVWALMIPVALTCLIVAVAAVFGSRLPALLPAHWNVAGEPDRFWSAGSVLGFNLLMAAVPTAYAIYTMAAGRTRLQQAATIALASLFSALAAGIYLQAVLWGLGRDVSALLVPIVVLSLVLPFAELTILARIGRAHEWRRELDSASRKEQR